MHEPSLLHVRDHSKAVGPAHHMLEYIAQHVNQYTGEAFLLTVDHLAYRLQVTPQWVGQLRRQLVESGELVVKQSRGRHPNVYVIPYERCHLCQQSNPNVEFGVDASNPKATPNQPQSNPKVAEPFGPDPARIAPPKVCKELKEKKEGSTPKWMNEEPKAETRSPFWCDACGVAIPTCEHRGSAAMPPTSDPCRQAGPARPSAAEVQAITARLRPGLRPTPGGAQGERPGRDRGSWGDLAGVCGADPRSKPPQSFLSAGGE